METQRLLLRGWRDDDLAPLADICRRVEVMQYIDGPWGKERVIEFLHKEQQQFEQLGHCRWALEMKDSGRLIGFCGFRPLAENLQHLEIGWRLHPGFWRQGLAYEAATAVISDAIENLRPERLFAKIHVLNKASLALALKLGMQVTTRVPVAAHDDYLLDYPLG